jgi:hypothetical protein
LIDAVSLESWEKLAMSLCGDREASPYAVAHAVKVSGGSGWFGEREIMFTAPEKSLVARNSYPMDEIARLLSQEGLTGPAF